MINYSAILNRFYPEANKLRDILLVHSRGVADLALRIFDAHHELFGDANLDVERDFIEAAAMLHDIGIINCNAPGIECYGTEFYICHGTIGARMIRSLDVDDAALGINEETKEALARVCERHTGTGLTREQIVKQCLPLPHCDFVPETMAEQIVCYADKFFSKTHPERIKTFEQAEHSLMKFGEQGIQKLRQWHELFDC